MDKIKSFSGGEFLVSDALPEDVFTPEDFTRDQSLIAKSAEEFHKKELLPSKDAIEEFDPKLLKKFLVTLGELGFLGADIPEVFGGTELDKISSTLISEKISPGVSGFNVTMMVQTGIGSIPIVMFGTRSQKEKYLPGLATGKIVGAYALTEPNHGSDALNAETGARLSDDGSCYILNGQKQFISNAGFADLFVTYAQVNDEKFTSFIVERGWEGVSVDQEEKKMGMHGSSTCSVIFKDVKVPAENVLGEIGRGHVVALNTLNIGRYKLGATAIGSAKYLLAETINYSKKRIQFNRPICEFGLIKHKIAEIIIRIYFNESMLYRTAGLLDKALEEIDLTKEDAGIKTGEAIREYAVECSINKVYGSETLCYTADECVQIFGGYGYIMDYPVEGAYRDSRINRIWEGTNEINRLLILDMLMKSAMKGKLPILNALQEVEQSQLQAYSSYFDAPECLEVEAGIVKSLKDLTLFTAGLAIKKYMLKLSDEQEIVAMISDMIIEFFVIESGLLRTLKMIKKNGEGEYEGIINITRVYIHDALLKMQNLSSHVLGAVCSGEELEEKMKSLKRLTDIMPINSIALRRKIADSAIRTGRYHITKN